MSARARLDEHAQPAQAAIQVGPPPIEQIRPFRKHRIPSWTLKVTMAATGILWAAFIGIHLFGNLKIFQGADAYNHYAHWLREAFYPLLPKLSVLWAMRVVLGLALIAHVCAAAMIWWRGRQARGPHRAKIRGARAWGAWLMPLTGVLIACFVAIHVLDLTLGWGIQSAAFTAPTADQSFAYENLVASFRRPAMAVFYSGLMLLLAIHVAKGFSTMASDMGAMGHRWRATLAAIGGLLALAILIGNGAIPILVLTGVIS